jgi:iron complex transport system ATP-binding protein
MTSIAMRTGALVAGYRSRKRDTRVLEQIDLVVQCRTLTAVVGSNGAGKSTLLRTMTGMQPPLSGKIFVYGLALSSMSGKDRAQRIAVVSTERQDTALLRVEEVVALGRHPHTGWAAKLTSADTAVIHRSIAQVQGEHLFGRYFSSLSDGEKQRITIARALAQEPAVLVLDEPTAFLDPRAKGRLMSLINDLLRGSDLAVLVATHDLDLVLPRADQTWVVGSKRVAAGTLQDEHILASLRTELGAHITGEADDLRVRLI